MTNTSNSNSQPKKPRYRKQLPNGISAAVFENTRDGRTYRSVNLQRSYKRDGKWNRMSLYLDHEHIPFVQEALQSVWQFLNEVPPSNSGEPDQAGEEIAGEVIETSDEADVPFESESA